MEVNVERLKELRRERVLSLRELEERSGVSYNTIWRLEDGRQGGASPDYTEAGGSSRSGACRAAEGRAVGRG
jgi:predicted DNA-binding transcriptional regulator AlpA